MAAPPHRTSIPPAPTRIQVQELLVEAVATVILCSVLVGFFFVLIATRSLTTALLCTLTVTAIVACWAGLAVVSGMLAQGLGMVESVVMMTSVGLMLDPITHVAFAYSEDRYHMGSANSPPQPRPQARPRLNPDPTPTPASTQTSAPPLPPPIQAGSHGLTSRRERLGYALSTIGISVSQSRPRALTRPLFLTRILYSTSSAPLGLCEMRRPSRPPSRGSSNRSSRARCPRQARAQCSSSPRSYSFLVSRRSSAP